MQEEIRNKVLLDLFVSCKSLLPIVGGLTTLIIAWAIGSMTLAATGLISLSVGTAVFATRLIFGLEHITQQAIEQIKIQKETDENKILDKLDLNLTYDKDPRPERCLRELRSLKKILKSKNFITGSEVFEHFNKMFDVCVDQISKSYVLWYNARDLSGSSKKKLKEQREQIVLEIEETTLKLTELIKDFSSTENNISENMKELEQAILVAKNTEERLSNFKSYDEKEFE